MNTQELRGIFESSGSPRRLRLLEEYTALESYINIGMIHLESHRLAAVPFGIQQQLLNRIATEQPWDEIAVIRAIPQLAMISHGGTRIHTMPCWCTAAWLIDQNYQVLAEQRYNGHRVDLLTTCKTWLIECGDTSPSPIPKHLMRGVQQVGILPFQQESPADNGTKLCRLASNTRSCHYLHQSPFVYHPHLCQIGGKIRGATRQ